MKSPTMKTTKPWYKDPTIIGAIIGAIALVAIAIFNRVPIQNFINPPPPKIESFTGKISDAKGTTRIHNAKVSLEGKGLPPVLYTDTEGIFKFDLSEGITDIKIIVEADGYMKFERRINISAKKELEDIRLTPIAETKSVLSGTVFDQNEKPIYGAKVTLDDIPGMPSVETSTDGVFNLKEIPKKYGEGVRVRVSKEGYQPNPYTEDVILGKAPPLIKLKKTK